MPSASNQSGQETVNKVLVEPLWESIEQEPFWGGWLITKLIALELVFETNQ